MPAPAAALEVIIGESHAELKHVIKMAAGASPPPPPAPPPAITAPRTPSAGGLVPVPEPVSKRTRARSAAAEAEAAAFRLVISAWQRRLRLARAMVVPIPRSAPGNSDDQADGDDDETEKHYEERCGGHVDARFGPANCSSLPLPVVHGQLLRLLRRLKAAAAEAGVPVWLDSGTLLGAWREGRIIAHDDDADVGMMRADIRRLPAIDTADMLLDINPHHVHADEDGDMLNMVDARLICKRTGVFVDVFGFSERMGVRDVLHTKYEGSMPGARDGSVELPWVATHELFPLQGCWLDGVRFQCPRNPYAVLTRYYGWDLSPLSPSELPERTTSS
eukprot:TRINITY_DN19722_c0_g1_i2.p1 TRINITY_DN19722_c0_g1~~TRINITY_DN19722_c0_g1_i2.p1  ORF type:complete len:333 (+),score=99.45 TRINITY_DN19722_c0_g1_i2:316-1314(+)